MGLDGVKTIGTVHNGFIFLQRSTNKVGEEKEHQENTPSRTAGQEVISKSVGAERKGGYQGKQKENRLKKRVDISWRRIGNRSLVSF